ncbi:hypothetical protein HW555_007068 [Spodoptera exigua]|uniref:Retrovirus-related Pol polyprotein from transposon TNT 1-94-like beta-barrel domain-containing protein n=1 Tax=Spodoptera exigua TaxID=7107 RepID=A0A835L9A4_SPOEX|nr:hypothetical protein HW555_007068 [Spodoptera exigua]
MMMMASCHGCAQLCVYLRDVCCNQSPWNEVNCVYTCGTMQTGHYRNQCTSDKDSVKSCERKQTHAFSAVFLNGSFSKNDWYIDSGASAHLTANKHWIKNVSVEHPIKEIVVANKEKVPVVCSGDVVITTLTDDCEYECDEKPTTFIEEQEDSVGEISDSSRSEYFTDDSDQTYVPDDESSASSVESVVSANKRCVLRRERRQPDRYGLSNSCIGSSTEFTGELSIQEALEGPEKEQWLEALLRAGPRYIRYQLQRLSNTKASGGPFEMCISYKKYMLYSYLTKHLQSKFHSLLNPFYGTIERPKTKPNDSIFPLTPTCSGSLLYENCAKCPREGPKQMGATGICSSNVSFCRVVVNATMEKAVVPPLVTRRKGTE